MYIYHRYTERCDYQPPCISFVSQTFEHKTVHKAKSSQQCRAQKHIVNSFIHFKITTNPPRKNVGYNRQTHTSSTTISVCKNLLRRLLLQIRLDTALPRLPIIVLLLRLRLLRIVAGEPSNGAADRAPNAILHATAQILHLALGLLALAVGVLLDAFLLQALGADEPADALLERANVLVPRAGRAVGVVLCDAAGCGGGEGTGLGGCVGEILLGGGFELAVFAFGLGSKSAGVDWEEAEREDGTYLVGGAAGERAESALCGALGLVEVALAGRGLVLRGRHGGGCGLCV